MFQLQIDHSGTLGTASTTCPPIVRAGSIGTWAVSVDIAEPLEAGGRIALVRRWPSDWGLPQSDDRTALDHLRIVADSGAPLRWWTEVMYPWHPFDHVLFVEALTGLASGDIVSLSFGDPAGGSPGATMQTFIEEASPLSVRVCPAMGGGWTEIAQLEVQVIGTDADVVVASAPSRVAAGEAFRIHVRVADRWGNPAQEFDDRFHVGGAGGSSAVVSSADGSFAYIDAVLDDVGTHRLEITQANGDLSTTTNPIVCERQPAERLYWGDMHGQSVVGCGARSVTDYFAHARGFAGCDVGSHQANCYMVTGPEWAETESVTAAAHQPGSFIPLLGVEWSAITRLGGDRNLYFPGDTAQLRRCSHEFVADVADVDTDLPHAHDLHDHYRDSDVVIALHVGGRTANLAFHDSSVERLIEVHSTHATSEWFLMEALRRGYRMGVIAGSDGVDGRPGASHPGHMAVRNVRGGLTAFAMPELSRAALTTAMFERRCYATTGERIYLDFSCDGHPYGTEYDADGTPTIEFVVEGTAPLDHVQIWRDADLLHDVPVVPLDPTPSNRIRVSWKGATMPGNWRAARMAWDGSLTCVGATISDPSGYAFDTPDEGITASSATQIQWRSVTAGDWDGIEFTVDDVDGATIEFVSDPLTFSLPLDELTDGSFSVCADEPMREVLIRRLPKALPSTGVSGSFVDPDAQSGTHAYWLRVLQHDGAQAWSSPVFATFAGEATTHDEGPKR